MINEFFALLLQVLFLLNIIFAIIMVFFERRNPATTWAWLIVLVLIPYVGFFIYLFFGQDSRKYLVFHKKSKEDDELYKKYINLKYDSLSFLKAQKYYMKERNILKIKGAEHLNDLVYLNYISGHGAFTTNNSLTLFHDGNEKFKSLFNDIKNAKEFIHLEYYIVRDDELGNRVIEMLAEKAREGLEVKLYVDGMGCFSTRKKFFKPLTDAGGELSIFFPPHFVRINFRNHRKLCVIDGEIGYIGGLNIGDEYLGKVKRYGFWRDSHIRIVGDSVKQLEVRFIMDWNFCSDNKLDFDEKYFKRIEKINDGVNMQIVSSGPDTKWHSIQYGYAKMIFEADKSIYIATPYFVPDDSIFEALRIAALSGIDVKIIIPAHPDHLFVYWASLSYLGELLNAGVKCYKYEKGFVHSKLIMIDGLVTSVGTANMDVRSFKLNFEINSFIYDKNITKQFQDKFLNDLNDCTKILLENYSKRSGIVKIKESVSRLISPLL